MITTEIPWTLQELSDTNKSPLLYRSVRLAGRRLGLPSPKLRHTVRRNRTLNFYSGDKSSIFEYHKELDDNYISFVYNDHNRSRCIDTNSLN